MSNHRGLSNLFNRGILSTLLIVCCVVGAKAQDASPPIDVEQLVALNQAIEAYLDGDADRAAVGFTEIRNADPKNVTASYYLGLINLSRGLAEAQAAGRDDEAARAKAREFFRIAQEDFEAVFEASDPTAKPVRAALLLGIAQLAGDDPEARDAALALALSAQDTLDGYVRTEIGAADRYGHFYLGVAHYRLADEYNKREDSSEANRHLGMARDSLSMALIQARVARDSDRIAAEQFTRFETVVTYYEGLVHVLNRDNLSAIGRFEIVVEREGGKTTLGGNAEEILDELESEEKRSPSRITFASPFGPLEFDAELSIGNFYDTNVILLGKDTFLPAGISTDDDYRFGVDFGFNVSRYISASDMPVVGKSLVIGFGGATFNAWQPDINDFDINSYLGRVFANWQPITDLYLGVQFEHAYTLLGKKPFITSNRITPVISKIWRAAPEPGDEDGPSDAFGVERSRTDIYFTMDHRDYHDRIGSKNLERDGMYQALGLRQVFNIMEARDLWVSYYATHQSEHDLFGHRWLRAHVGYVYRNERTEGSEFDLWGHSFGVGVELPLPYRLSFDFQAEWTWDHYTSASIFDFRRNQRFDLVQRYDFGLTHTLVARGEAESMRTLEMKLRAGVGLTYQNSNIFDRLGQDIYEYDRAIYGLSLTMSF